MSNVRDDLLSRTEVLCIASAGECNTTDDLLEALKYFRNACSKGSESQNLIVSNTQICCFIENILFSDSASFGNLAADIEKVHLFTWQLLANLCVQNEHSQSIVWNKFGKFLISSCLTQPLHKYVDITLMILFNVFNNETKILDDYTALWTMTKLWNIVISEECVRNLEFLHIFFEHFLVQARSTTKTYAKLESENRISFLNYVSVYIRNDSPNGPINNFLLQFLSKEFKIKSDYILRDSSRDVEKSYPNEAYALLRVIASASGSELYASTYRNDHSLFINVSSLLSCLVAAGKKSQNKFTPMTKLHEVAPSSNISSEYELDISFELKTLLVRAIANLLYKNKSNQGYCIDTQLMPVLLECTNMDARNPLIKEWSILAIRNACMDCPEIQEMISQLTQKGVAQSDILSELNLEMGSLRIKPNN